jgi:hypothetical protein
MVQRFAESVGEAGLRRARLCHLRAFARAQGTQAMRVRAVSALRSLYKFLDAEKAVTDDPSRGLTLGTLLEATDDELADRLSDVRLSTWGSVVETALSCDLAAAPFDSFEFRLLVSRALEQVRTCATLEDLRSLADKPIH